MPELRAHANIIVLRMPTSPNERVSWQTNFKIHRFLKNHKILDFGVQNSIGRRTINPCMCPPSSLPIMEPERVMWKITSFNMGLVGSCQLSCGLPRSPPKTIFAKRAACVSRGQSRAFLDSLAYFLFFYQKNETFSEAGRFRFMFT